MSIAQQLRENFDDNTIAAIGVDKSAILNGESAVRVSVSLTNGKFVEGTFATESKPGFGGVEFESKKDVVGLMTAKVDSVLRGTAE